MDFESNCMEEKCQKIVRKLTVCSVFTVLENRPQDIQQNPLKYFIGKEYGEGVCTGLSGRNLA